MRVRCSRARRKSNVMSSAMRRVGCGLIIHADGVAARLMLKMQGGTSKR